MADPRSPFLSSTGRRRVQLAGGDMGRETCWVLDNHDDGTLALAVRVMRRL